VSSLQSPTTTRRSRPSRRGRAGLATAALLVAAAPLATACGAGFNSAALEVEPNAGAGTVGSLKVGNVWVVVDPGTGNAEVIGSVANTGSGPASVTGVQVGGDSAQIRLPADPTADAGSYPIDGGARVSFGRPQQPEIALSGSTLAPGDLVKVTFSFGAAGKLDVTAQIQSDTGLWAEYDPNAANATPSPSASASASALASSSASASASSSASASASASASPSSTK
jgi:hypothetical protein